MVFVKIPLDFLSVSVFSWPIIVGSVVGGVAFFVIIVAIVCCAAKSGHRAGRVINPNTTSKSPLLP